MSWTLTRQKKRIAINIAAGTSTEDLIALVTGKRIRILGGTLFTSAAGDFQLLSAATAISGIQSPSGAGIWTLEKSYEYTTVAGEALRISRSASARVTGELIYEEID